MIKEEDELRLRHVASEILGIDEFDLQDDSGPETVVSWTSFNHLNLMGAVEQAFDIMFSMEEMGGVKTYADLKELVGSHR